MKYYLINIDKNIFLLLFCFTFLECKQDKAVKIVHAAGLGTENLHLRTLVFQSDEIGFAGGNNTLISQPAADDINRFAIVKKNAKIFKTTDGGINWRKYDLGIGDVTKIIADSNNIIASKYDDSQNKSTILKYYTNDVWKELSFIFPGIISELFIVSGKLFFLGKDAVNTFRLFRVNDSLNSYSSLQLPDPIFDCNSDDEHLFCLTSKKSLNQNIFSLIIYTILSNSYKKVVLPVKLDFPYLTCYNKSLRIFDLEGKKVKEYIMDLNGNITSEMSYSDKNKVYPVGSYNTNSTQYIVISKYEGSMISKFIIKSNSKNDWNIIKFEKDTYIEPFWINEYGGKIKGWFYSGRGLLQQFTDK